jgi:predicted NBD/HSP70 family sugar kinase
MSNEVWPPPGVRGVNLDTVAGILQQRREVTRAELIAESGLSKATVSGIVTDLLDREFAVESGKVAAGRGRRRDLLTFNPRSRFVVGAQIDDDVITVVLTDLDAAVHHRTTRRIHGSSPEPILDALADAVEKVRAHATTPVLGFGVGVPGDVAPSGRSVTMAVSHGWKELAIADQLESRLALPVVAANRAKVAALGHLRRNSTNNLIYVFLGSGIVAGIVIDGRLYFGRSGAAGDIGHLTVRRDGMLCACGNHGCLHTVAAEEAILRLARATAREPESSGALTGLTGGRPSELTMTMVGTAAAAADPDVCAVLDDVGTDIGIVVANLVNTLSPDVVVIGGPTVALGTPLLDPIRREIGRRTLPEMQADVVIGDPVADGETSAAGAAALYISRMPSVLRA